METRAKHIVGGCLIGLASAPLLLSSVFLALLLVDRTAQYFFLWAFTFAGACIAVHYGLKNWGKKRRHITIGLLCTSVGAITGLIALTFPIVINSKAWRVAGGSVSEGRMGFAFLIYAVALLGIGIPFILYQRKHGGLYSYRRTHNIRTGAKIRPGDRPVRSNYRPD